MITYENIFSFIADSGHITAKIKEDFLDARQGPESGLFSKLKSNLVDVIVCNAVGPHNFCVRFNFLWKLATR